MHLERGHLGTWVVVTHQHENWETSEIISFASICSLFACFVCLFVCCDYSSVCLFLASVCRISCVLHSNTWTLQEQF